MIVFDLLCREGHRFEGWFGSAEDYASQRERELVSCPACGSVHVERVPTAARLNFGAKPPKPPVPAKPATPAVPADVAAKAPEMEGKDPFSIALMLYSRMVDELVTKSEDVGEKFPEEARKIYYQEAPARMIRGQATKEQHDELVEEGIPVMRLPIPPADQMN